jgi:hypothetical protein
MQLATAKLSGDGTSTTYVKRSPKRFKLCFWTRARCPSSDQVILSWILSVTLCNSTSWAPGMHYIHSQTRQPRCHASTLSVNWPNGSLSQPSLSVPNDQPRIRTGLSFWGSVTLISTSLMLIPAPSAHATALSTTDISAITPFVSLPQVSHDHPTNIGPLVNSLCHFHNHWNQLPAPSSISYFLPTRAKWRRLNRISEFKIVMAK